MRKDKRRKTMTETLSKIDSVLVSLDGYPELEDALLEKGQDITQKALGKVFPTQLDFSMNILEHLVGKDVLIDLISGYLIYALPPLEIVLKTALLANMRNLITSCTIDPIIYEQAIKEGIVFDLKQIDLYDKLKVSPLDKQIGQYYYFGIDDCETSYDILESAISPNNQSDTKRKKIEKKGSTIKQETSYMNRAFVDSVGHYFGGRKRDFDCLLWYMKNKSITRQVWGKRTSASEDIFNGEGSTNEQDWVDINGKKGTKYYSVDFDKQTCTVYEKKEEPIPFNFSKDFLINEEKEYLVQIEGIWYVYRCKTDSIKKIDRKKVYYIHQYIEKIDDNGVLTKTDDYEAYRYSKLNNAWICEKYDEYKQYQSIEEAIENDSKNIEIGNYLVIDNNLVYVTDIEYEPIVTELKIKKLKTDNCIDVTTDIINNNVLYVDYDEIITEDPHRTKKDVINDGEIPETTFVKWVNVGYENDVPKIWKKHRCGIQKPKGNNYIEVLQNTQLYYGLDSVTNEYKVIIPPYDDKGAFTNVNKLDNKKNKYTKEFGVLTLEYNQRTGNILQSDGHPMHQQTPYDNSIHVFFGNVKELHTQERDKIEEDLRDCSSALKNVLGVLDKLEIMQLNHSKIWAKKMKKENTKLIRKFGKDIMTSWDGAFNYGKNYYKVLMWGGEHKTIDNAAKDTYFNYLNGDYEGYDDVSFLNSKISEIDENVERLVKLIYTGPNNKKEFNIDVFIDDFEKKMKEILVKDEEQHEYYSIDAILKRIGKINEASEDNYYLKSTDLKYPEAKKNYYLYRTLFEFNFDYINSIQLFDAKVVAAQLIASLFGGGISIGLNASFSWKTELIRDTVKDMVEKTIASEDFAVSDCFFTFTNDAYNGMLRAADLKQAGIYSKYGEEKYSNKVDPIKLLSGLNNIDNSTDKSEQTSIIKGAIMDAAVELTRDETKKNKERDFGIDASFLITLLKELCTQLVMALLSPKVYLLILINLELFGFSTNFDIKTFIKNFENLIRTLVKSIVDHFMQYLKDFILTLMFGGKFQNKSYKGIIPELSIKIGLEQAEMYARLLKQILLHLRMLFKCGKTIGWQQDYVEYADITDSEQTQEPIDEC